MADERKLVGFFIARVEKVERAMATYHFEVKSGKKGTAKNHAQYIARLGKFAERKDLLATGYGNLPEGVEDDPLAFWRSADLYERANGAAYREFVVALPNEFHLTEDRKFLSKLIPEVVGDRPYQWALHGPEGKLEGIRNVHAHIMFSDRASDGVARPIEQVFRRYNRRHPEQGGRKKASGGRTALQLRDELIAKRKLVADVENEMLAEVGSLERVDYRSYRDRGIARKPERHLGPARVNRMSRLEKAVYVGRRSGDELARTTTAAAADGNETT